MVRGQLCAPSLPSPLPFLAFHLSLTDHSEPVTQPHRPRQERYLPYTPTPYPGPDLRILSAEATSNLKSAFPGDEVLSAQWGGCTLLCTSYLYSTMESGGDPLWVQKLNCVCSWSPSSFCAGRWHQCHLSVHKPLNCPSCGLHRPQTPAVKPKPGADSGTGGDSCF